MHGGSSVIIPPPFCSSALQPCTFVCRWAVASAGRRRNWSSSEWGFLLLLVLVFTRVGIVRACQTRWWYCFNSRDRYSYSELSHVSLTDLDFYKLCGSFLHAAGALMICVRMHLDGNCNPTECTGWRLCVVLLIKESELRWMYQTNKLAEFLAFYKCWFEILSHWTYSSKYVLVDFHNAYFMIYL